MTDLTPVYVTSHGKRYHSRSHNFTGSGKAETTRRIAESMGYEPCSVCFNTSPARPALGRDPSRSYLSLKRGGG